ncbi:MAG: NADH-quinone oxidoreductase subunit M [Parachlamydiaceae bacterium]|nr:NADH-quinone oxidoreductase subunit M [Parachlamydiaceae bacterium]
MLKIFLLFLFPVLSAIAMLLLPNFSSKNLKRIALVLSAIPLVALMVGRDWIGTEVNYAWLPALGIRFHLIVDNLSFLFLMLSALIIPFSLLAVRSSTLTSPHVFFALVLFLQSLLFGFFTSRDLALFTMFYEAMLLPLYLMIMIWGGPNRRKAALKFIIYMIAGSVLMVAGVLFLYISSVTVGGEGTFNLDALAKTASSTPYASWVFGIFLLAFAVKTPLFPFHAWLPDAYYEASTSGTILLSAILSKAGVYGILRIAYELFPELLKVWSPVLLGMAIAGVFYGGFLAWRQTDFKRLIAYSSLSHVNFILAGLFAISQTSLAGGILQALNHGITITGLFLVAGWLEERLGSTSLKQARGLCKYLPQLCWLTLFFVVASVAIPGTNNFVGELMILFGLFQNPWVAALLGLSIILSVIYMLRWMQFEYFGQPSPYQHRWVDIHAKHIIIALPLVILILLFGIYPAPVLNLIKPAVEKISTLANLEQS